MLDMKLQAAGPQPVVETEVLDETPIDLSKVYSSYNGKIGCMCGCNGKYRYAKAHQEFAGKNRGYAVSNDEIGEKSIQLAVNKINRDIANYGMTTDCNDPNIKTKVYFIDHDDVKIYSIETETRITAVYVLK